jgi:hypothetical protein
MGFWFQYQMQQMNFYRQLNHQMWWKYPWWKLGRRR